MKRLLLLAVACFAPIQSSAQVCKLTLEQSPEVRGLKLGQSLPAVIKHLPGRLHSEGSFEFRTTPQPDEVGFAKHSVSVERSKSPTFAGILTIGVQFLDAKLVAIDIMYDPNIEWKSDLEFTASVAANLKLPTKGWRGSYPTFLECDGFSVATYSSYRLVIAQIGIPEELAKRKRELNDKKRREFKP